jgi:apolipoprotein N-acyltransferase
VNLGLSLLSSLLFVLIFPRFDLTWLAPIALTPMLIACARERSAKRRFLQGWAAGIVLWGGVCYWTEYVMSVHAGMGPGMGWLAFVLFALYMGLTIAVFTLLARPAMLSRAAIPLTAALWTGIERLHGYTGLSWLHLGNAGIDMPVPMRLAPLAGVYGVSFVFAMLGCAVALIVLRRPRRELWPLFVLPLLLVLRPLPPYVPGTETVQVVQPNIDTEAEWTGASLADLERSMATLSYAPRVPLIVWPEAPAPFYPDAPEFKDFIESVTAASRAPLLFEAIARTPKGEPLNSVFFAEAAGGYAGRYDQINLVPFGEFVPSPFSWLINKVTKEAGDFVPGSKVVTFPLDGHRIAAVICYESAFPDLVRQFPQQGAEMLFNLSNDGYFGKTGAREQHFSLARMRAAENRRWILEATNDGITAMIDPAGRVTERLPSFRAVAGMMSYNNVSETTFYTRHGDWFAWSCLAAGLGFALQGLFRSAKLRKP